MNYRHIYHAGIFADIFKHSILTLLIESLLNKEKPFCYIDTHAGIGLYDLQQAAAQKTKEYTTGLLPLMSAQPYPALIKPYLAAIAAYNATDAINKLPRYYPGSPAIARYFLRAQDRMLLNELHREDFQLLQQFFRRDKQVIVQQMDAYQAIKALLPPAERRGLVFIDPAYEDADEFQLIHNALLEGVKRWETGIYALWYPIKDKMLTDKFLRKVKKHSNKALLVAEMTIYPDTLRTRLNGCGLLIINPPWQLAIKLKELMPWLWEVLSPERQGEYSAELI